MGIVSSTSNSQQEVLASLREGRPGITFSQEPKDSGVRNRVWGNVRLGTTSLISCKVMRFMDDAPVYAYLSVEQAIAGTGLALEAYQSNPRVGPITGSDGGSPKFQAFGADTMRSSHGLEAVGPYVVAKAMVSDVSIRLATPFKTHGINCSISLACATSVHCISDTVEQIQLGKQGIVFAGGDEELCREMVCESSAMGALSTEYNDTPEKASRTYDTNCDGFVIAGGGGMVVVEELEHALACDAHIYAEIVGCGATSDSADTVAPSDEDAMHCMQMVIHGIGTSIGYLNSHGTSTLAGNMKELGTIRGVFGDNGPTTSVTRAMTGHSSDVAGVQEAVYSLLILEHGFVAPSTNIGRLDEQVVGLNIVTRPTGAKLTTVMSNSFGFDGTNTTLVMHKYNV